MNIIKSLLKNTIIDPKVNLDVIVNLTEGYSGADLAEMINQTKQMAIKEEIENEINKERLLKIRPDAINEIPPENNLLSFNRILELLIKSNDLDC